MVWNCLNWLHLSIIHLLHFHLSERTFSCCWPQGFGKRESTVCEWTPEKGGRRGTAFTSRRVHVWYIHVFEGIACIKAHGMQLQERCWFMNESWQHFSTTANAVIFCTVIILQGWSFAVKKFRCFNYSLYKNFAEFLFVAFNNRENILTTKISRFTAGNHFELAPSLTKKYYHASKNSSWKVQEKEIQKVAAGFVSIPSLSKKYYRLSLHLFV